MDLLEQLRQFFPELFEAGLGDIIAELVREDASPMEVVARVRASSEYKAIFPGMTNKETGQLRFDNERAYIDYVNSVKDVLGNHGRLTGYESPQDFVGFMEDQVDPGELNDRLTVYGELERGSQEIRDAFYIYAGMDIGVDDLYQAVVDPDYGRSIMQAYDETVAVNSLDYETFLNRSAEVALRSVARLAQDMVAQGLITSQAAQQMLNVNPNQARNVLGALYTGGVAGGPGLSISELQQSFQAAMLGSAFSEQGLNLPSLEKIQELRAAGVDRARALSAAGNFAQRQELFSSIGMRAGVTIDQSTFTNAALLSQGSAVKAIERAVGKENALGQAGGGFQTQLSEGRLVQEGRRRL